MIEHVIIGMLATALISALLLSFFLWRTRESYTRIWRERARTAEDRQHAAELRAGEQIDAMLGRLHSPVLGPAERPTPTVDPEVKRHISDLPYDDERWNEYRGETEDDES